MAATASRPESQAPGGRATHVSAIETTGSPVNSGLPAAICPDIDIGVPLLTLARINTVKGGSYTGLWQPEGGKPKDTPWTRRLLKPNELIAAYA
jgi:hypothetical protein